ncbi:MAG: SDR family oxidoreductase [Blastocatellia bacterium]|nr:SDR family oxidoreductase [Blastocatellia bacterium]
MSERILVTGATGNVGSQLVRQLSAAGIATVAAVRSIERAASLKLPNVELIEFDTEKPESFAPAFSGIGKLFLVPPLVEDMLGYTSSIVEAAKKAGVSHIVKLSGLGADLEPGIQLGRWHRATERIIEESEIAFTHLRPNSFMQNYLTFYGHTIKTQNSFYLPQGDGKISLIDTRDIASVAVAVFTKDGHKGKAYDLTGSEALSNYDVAEVLSEVTARKISYIDVPEDAARQSMLSAGTLPWMTEALLELSSSIRAGYTAAVSNNVEKITGKKPITFRQFAEEFASQF